MVDNTTAGIGSINPIRCRGYYYDAETGFCYCGSRYYNPEIGRWINADGYVSTGQGLSGFNMFAYCGNNPINRADSIGKFWGIALLGVVVVGIISLTGCGTSSGATSSAVSTAPASTTTTYSSATTTTTTSANRPVDSDAQVAVAQTILGEAGGRFKYPDTWKNGQEAVVWTIINRYESPSYPDDWLKIVSAENQFVGYVHGKNKYESNDYDSITWDYAYELAGYAVAGQYECIPRPSGFTDQHMFFRQDKGQSYDSWEGIIRIAGNVFFYYKEG